MPRIVPIRDLKNTTAISTLCHEDDEPIFITKNGYGDMVVMSMSFYEQTIGRNDVYARLAEAEADVAAGRVKPAREVISRLRSKVNVHR